VSKSPRRSSTNNLKALALLTRLLVHQAYLHHSHLLEGVEDVVALLLPLVTVDGCRAELARDAVAELVTHALGGAEDHDAVSGLGAQDALQRESVGQRGYAA